MKNDLLKLFDDFINECHFSSGLRPETLRGYRAVFDLFLKVMPEVTSVDFLTSEMMNEFFKRIQTRQRIIGRNTVKTGVKKSTIKTQWSKLHVFFQWLLIKNYIEENPLKYVRPPRVIYDVARALEKSDIDKLYGAVTRHSSNSFILRRDTMMVSILLYCGLRKGELISLRVSDLDMEKRLLTVRGETSKSKFTRVLPMHPTLILHVKEYFKEINARGLKTGCLIAANKGDSGLTPEGLKHWVKKLVKKSGVTFHLHRLRHTFACKLVENGVHPFNIQKMMGHTSLAMTLTYVRSMKTQNMESDIDKLSY